MDDYDDNDNHDAQGQVEGVLSSTVKNKKIVFVSFAPVQEMGTPSTCPGVS